MTTPLLCAEDLVLAYDDRAVLRGASLELAVGARASLSGPSGGGKTTLLRVLAGLERPDAGRVLVGGEVATDGRRLVLPPWRRGIQLVFQDLGLWPTRTALQNVADAVAAVGLDAPRRRAEEALSRLGLADLAGRRPAHLSGGEARRLAMARALATRPRILLLDEPFASLDPEARREGFAWLEEVLADTEAAVLLVTHDPWEVDRLGGAALRLEEGRIR